MNFIYAAVAIMFIFKLAMLASMSGVGTIVVATVIPYAAGAALLAGICWRVSLWARSPVPFRIPTTCGQQKSLPWIKPAILDNPSSGIGAVGRMTLEILLFRSLFRNNRAELDGQRYVFGDSKLLWLGGLLFHLSLLAVLIRHARFFLEHVPLPVMLLARLDGFFQVCSPVLYLSNVVIVAALFYLLLRRFNDPRLRYISQFSDYFAPLLLLAIVLCGMLMRYVARVDVVAVKQLTLGLVTFHPAVPEGISAIVLVHMLLVSALAVYFPFSKLMHMGGVFLSPTRNLANNSRMKRHINPWDYPVKTHSYEEWQEEFHDKIKMAGIPLDEAPDGRSNPAD